MTRWRAPDVAALGLIAAVLLATGPAVGVVDTTREAPELGEGTASVVEAGFEGDPAIERGRFGTGVVYVRPPTATAVVESVEGRPRLLLRVRVRGLSSDASTATLLDGAGRYRLALPDRGVPAANVTADRYAVTATLAVQSFDGRRVVAERTRTVAVER